MELILVFWAAAVDRLGNSPRFEGRGANKRRFEIGWN